MSLIRNVSRLVQQNIRKASTSAFERNEKEIPEGLKKLRSIQKRFQKNDGLPVHIKSGTTDKVLYYSTWALCFYSLGITGKFFYDLTYPSVEN